MKNIMTSRYNIKPRSTRSRKGRRARPSANAQSEIIVKTTWSDQVLNAFAEHGRADNEETNA